MLHSILMIFALTLNLAVNHLHAADDEFPDWTELPPLRDNDETPQQRALQQASQVPNDGNDGYQPRRITLSTPSASSSSSQYVTTQDGWLGYYGSFPVAPSYNRSYPENFNQAMLQNLTPYSFLNTLVDGMWGTGDYQLPEYHGDSNQLIPLTKEMVMTPFFAMLEKASIEERTALFTRISQLKLSGSKAHITRRYNMMALIFSGPVDILATQKQATLDWHDPVWIAAHESDEYLLQQLLANGASAINDRFPDRTPLREARITSIAYLLIKAGSNPANIKGLLHRSMDKSRPVGLVAEYLAMGCDPMAQIGSENATPLAWLINAEPHTEMAAKAQLLFDKLPAHKIRTLLNNIDGNRGSAFIQLTTEKKNITRIKASWKKAEELVCIKALFNVLIKAGKDAGMSAEIFEDCPFCLGMLCKQVMRTTFCGHTFHAQCLGSLPTCPICRASLMTPETEQYLKNKMLFETRIHTFGNNAEQHKKWRNNIIKALQLGADIRAVRDLNLLAVVTAIGDCELMQHMIECGADIHEQGVWDKLLPIHCAHNVPEAELLVSYGALSNPHVQPQLFFNLGNLTFKPELITYYRKLGIKPTYQDAQNNVSALMYFVTDTSANTLDKIQRLLQGLTAQEVATILSVQDSRKKTIFDYIKEYKREFRDCKGLKDLLNRLDSIEQYLRAVEKDPSLPSREEVPCNIAS